MKSSIIGEFRKCGNPQSQMRLFAFAYINQMHSLFKRIPMYDLTRRQRSLLNCAYECLGYPSEMRRDHVKTPTP